MAPTSNYPSDSSLLIGHTQQKACALTMTKPYVVIKLLEKGKAIADYFSYLKEHLISYILISKNEKVLSMKIKNLLPRTCQLPRRPIFLSLDKRVKERINAMCKPILI